MDASHGESSAGLKKERSGRKTDGDRSGGGPRLRTYQKDWRGLRIGQQAPVCVTLILCPAGLEPATHVSRGRGPTPELRTRGKIYNPALLPPHPLSGQIHACKGTEPEVRARKGERSAAERGA